MPSKIPLDDHDSPNNENIHTQEKMISKDEFIGYLDSHLQHTFAMMQENKQNIEVK